MPGAVFVGLGAPLNMSLPHCHAAGSAQIGSGFSCPSMSGMQVNPLLPFLTSTSLPSSPGISTVASLDIFGGAALIASMIKLSFDIVGIGLLFSANEYTGCKLNVTTATAKTCLTCFL